MMTCQIHQLGHVSIFAEPGDDITCTFMNTQQTVKLTIVKEAIGGDERRLAARLTGSHGSAVQPEDATRHSPKDLQRPGGRILRTGQECLPDGWDLTNAKCLGPMEIGSSSYPTRVLSIPQRPGDDITCTFTNEVKTGHDHHREGGVG